MILLRWYYLPERLIIAVLPDLQESQYCVDRLGSRIWASLGSKGLWTWWRMIDDQYTRQQGNPGVVVHRRHHGSTSEIDRFWKTTTTDQKSSQLHTRHSVIDITYPPGQHP